MAVPVLLPAEATGPSGFAANLERRAGITVTGLLAFVFAAGGWMAAHQFGGRTLYLIAYCGAGLLIIGIVLARRRRPVDAVRSELPRRARVGQVLPVELTLTTKSRISAFTVQEELPPHLGRTVVVPVPLLSPGQELKHRFELTPLLRGVYKVGPLTAEFSDPMGLAKRRQVLLAPIDLVVHPKVDEVLDRPLTRAFEDPPLRPPNSRPWPEGFEFYGMRDYVAGDDIRRVVWSAFARTDKLLVREFEQGISDRIAIVIDTDQEWHSTGEPSDTFETAVSVAASVGVRHIKDGFSVRLFANGTELGGQFRGPRARLPFLDQLAALNRGEEPLANAVERIARSGRRDAHVVIITSNFDSKSAARANLLINSGASITVCAVLWDESDPLTTRRAREVGAQLVQVKPGSSLGGVFRASLQTNQRSH